MIVLGASDVEPWTVGDLLKLEKLDLNKITLSYDEVSGDPTLRKVIAKSYSKPGFTSKNILVTTGASEAILLAMHASLTNGDTALVCHPAYQGLAEMAETAGAQVLRYEYREDHRFAPDLKVIKDRLRNSPPKVLLLNSPHNPTGQVIRQSDLTDLLNLANVAGTRVIVDEVFHGIWIRHRAVPSAINLNSEAVVIGCLSKVYGLPGLRVGWLAGPDKFIKKCKQLRYYTSLTAPSVVQQLGEIAVKHRETLLKRGQQNVTRNYNKAIEWLDSHRKFFDYVRPQGGTVMLLRLKSQVDTKTFAEKLATKQRVFLVPCAWTFDMNNGYMRLGLGLKPELFDEGLSKLESFLRTSVKGKRR